MIALEASAAAISYIALALLLGHLVTAAFLLPGGEPKELRRSLMAGANVGLSVFLCASLVALLIQGVKLQRGFPSLELLWRYLTMTQSGKVWLLRELLAAALALFLWQIANKTPSLIVIRLATLLAVLLVAGRSVASHAAAVREDTALIVAANAGHLIVTAFWAGGLCALWRAVHSDQSLTWIDGVVRRFSRLALLSVALLVLSGLYQSWIHVGSFTALANTDYGKVLGLKLLLLSVMLGIGALNYISTRRLLTHAASHGPHDVNIRETALRRIGVESLLGLSIFCVTGLLTALPPAIHAQHQASTAATPPVEQTVESIVKKYLPAEGAAVKILAPAAGQVFASDQVPLKFSLAKGIYGHHVHAYVDGELMGMFQSKAGNLNGVKPGRHILELRIVTADHQSELDAFDRVEFMVK